MIGCLNREGMKITCRNGAGRAHGPIHERGRSGLAVVVISPADHRAIRHSDRAQQCRIEKYDAERVEECPVLRRLALRPIDFVIIRVVPI